MKVIADLHLHSKYSRATSKQMSPDVLIPWAGKKGINLLATGDATHPRYLAEMKEYLVEDGSGLLSHREHDSVKYVLESEISCIYRHNDKTRRQHLLVYLPSFAAQEKLNASLVARGCNLKSDGRPIIGLSAHDLTALALECHEQALIVPAHIWTPWFSLFGSKSGYDSIQECFGDLSSYIYAAETGLSSDPPMNWRLSQLDQVTLLSNSDAHSPAMLGREANVFEMERLTYDDLYNIIKFQDREKFLYTIEFYPEEGKYHYDGHASCKVCFSPSESLKNKNICPVCKKELVLGVDHRVQALADRAGDVESLKRIPFVSVIPLPEILSECLQVGRASKKVQGLYEKMTTLGGNEFNILLNLSREEIETISNDRVAEAIIRMREKRVYRQPGYDGVFGQIKVFSPEEQSLDKARQRILF